MRETYELSEETRKALNNNAGAFAEELHKSDKYFYAILAGTETDPFAKFEPLYAAGVRLGVACHWKNKLAAIDARYAHFHHSVEPAECVKEKIQAYSKFLEKFIDSLSDGQLELHEIKELEVKLGALKDAVEHCEKSLSFQRGLLEAEKEKSKSKLRAA